MGQGCRPAQLRRVTLGCAASEQVPGAGEGALTRHLERKCGFSRGKGVLVAGGQAEGREVLLAPALGGSVRCGGAGCCVLCVWLKKVQRLNLGPWCRHGLECGQLSDAEISAWVGEGCALE